MKHSSIACVAIALFFIFYGDPSSANVPIRVLVKGELLGKGLSPSNLLHESDGSSILVKNALCALAATTGGCAGWLASGSSLATGLCGLSAGVSAFLHFYYDTRRFSVFLGSTPFSEGPEFPLNQRYVPLLRTLLRGGDLRVASQKEITLHRPDLELVGAFTSMEIHQEVLSAKQIADGRKPRTLRVQFVELSSVLARLDGTTYSFDDLEPAPPEWDEIPLFR